MPGILNHLLPATADFVLSEVDPDSTPGWSDGKSDGEKALAEGDAELGQLQEMLFAASTSPTPRPGTDAADSSPGAPTADAPTPIHSVLVVLQAMDTAGKGGIVRHAFGGADPAGIMSHAFKAPTEEERRHDFLWRIRRELPTPGHIGIFDRSHYEDVLVHRVRHLSPPDEVGERYGIINQFEADVAASGTAIIKIMLHISADEQRDRLAERLDRPDKLWKFNPGDIDDRLLWADYQEAYEIAIRRTASPESPWYVVPANRKWYARLAVQTIVLEKLRSLNLEWPAADFDIEEQKARLAAS